MSKTVRPEVTDDLKIFENVICKIVEIAAADVEGVCGFVKSKVDFADLFIRADRRSAIDVKVSDGSAEISLGINVSGKCRVRNTAEKVQQRVKDSVQSMTGIAVTKVNVYIYGIVFDNEENSAAEDNE
ncbi:MAG: Asp23/Gls24 family envelope stress response protein [Prevotella sp.]|nr:Asp23/Gls24 family envelope stress response protein [Prevotella sp.]